MFEVGRNRLNIGTALRAWAYGGPNWSQHGAFKERNWLDLLFDGLYNYHWHEPDWVVSACVWT